MRVREWEEGDDEQSPVVEADMQVHMIVGIGQEQKRWDWSIPVNCVGT